MSWKLHISDVEVGSLKDVSGRCVEAPGRRGGDDAKRAAPDESNAGTGASGSDKVECGELEKRNKVRKARGSKEWNGSDATVLGFQEGVLGRW